MKKLLVLALAVLTCRGAYSQESGITFLNEDYEKTNVEVHFGYVNKYWINTYSVGTRTEDFFGEPGGFFNGMQIGALFTPSLDCGVGLRTGLMLEFYVSTSAPVRYFGWSNFTESDLYIPLHASYRFPFAEDIGLTIFGGAAFQLAMQGRYNKIIGVAPGFWYRRPVVWGYSERQAYGNGWPRQVNWQAELGLNFRLRLVAFNISYSFGLNYHGIQNCFDESLSFETASKSRQDKMEFSIAFPF